LGKLAAALKPEANVVFLRSLMRFDGGGEEEQEEAQEAAAGVFAVYGRNSSEMATVVAKPKAAAALEATTIQDVVDAAFVDGGRLSVRVSPSMPSPPPPPPLPPSPHFCPGNWPLARCLRTSERLLLEAMVVMAKKKTFISLPASSAAAVGAGGAIPLARLLLRKARAVLEPPLALAAMLTASSSSSATMAADRERGSRGCG